MPAAETTAGRRSGRLPQYLFWSGASLAPLAVLLLLVGSGAFVMQIAGVFAVLAVLAMGLSLWLRFTSDDMRTEIEDVVFEETDALREDIRTDISTAVRATHKSLGEKMVELNDTVAVLRNQVDAMRGQIERVTQPPAPAPQKPNQQPNVLRHTETVQVTTRQTMLVDPNDAHQDGTVYGGRAQVGGDYGRAPAGHQYGAPAPPQYDGRPQPGPSGTSYGSARVPPASGRVSSDRILHEPPRNDYDERPGYDERSGYDERPNYDERPGGAYEGRASASAQVPQQRRPDWAPAIESGPHQESWTEQLLRERTERQQAEERTGGGRRRAPEDDGDRTGGDRVTGYRTADRWAEVRSDDRGRELQMGERRSAVRENPGGGTEMRIEDRWAAIRREDDRRNGRHESWDPEPRTDPRNEPHSGDWAAAGAWDQESRTDPRREDAAGPRRSAASREREAERERTTGTFTGSASPPPPPVPPQPTRQWSDEGQWAASAAVPQPPAASAQRSGRRQWSDEGQWADPNWERPSQDIEAGRWGQVRQEQRGLTGMAGALPSTPAEPTTRWSDTSGVYQSQDTGGRRRRDDDEDYRWNGARAEEPRANRTGGMPRRLVEFEQNDDRWR
jgi:hypothetical protein